MTGAPSPLMGPGNVCCGPPVDHRCRPQETTARGVQPQIEQMMKQHAEETARLRQHYEAVLAGGGHSV